MKRPTVSLIGFAALTLIGGCASTEIDPKFDMEDKRVAVIPFVDKEVPIGPSDISVILTRLIAMDIARENLDDIEMWPPKAVEEFFESRDIRELSTQEIGEALGVHYVIHGEIHEFNTEGHIIGMNSGIFRGVVRVHDVDKGMTVFQRPVDVEYPPRPIPGIPEDTIRSGLLRNTSSRIGRLFYHHEPSDEPWEIR